MSARDTFHGAVKNALRKEGWTITDDPLFIRGFGIEVQIDLGAEKMIGAERDGEKIAVKVKSFVGTSAISEFHVAVGQFMNYQLVLEKQEPERVLYLAVPQDTYDTFFALEFAELAVRRYQLKLMVYDPGNEVVVKWRT